MSDERPSEIVAMPDYRGHVRLYDDRVGMSVQQLLDRAEEAQKELEAELDVLHRSLPRKSEKRLGRTTANKRILSECIRGARARTVVAARAAEGLGGR